MVGEDPSSTPGGMKTDTGVDAGPEPVPGLVPGARHDVVATTVPPAHYVRAYRRLVGTGIAAVSEEACGILSGDAVESGTECLLQRLDGTRGDPAQVDFHLGPTGFDRAQVWAVGGQIAISEA